MTSSTWKAMNHQNERKPTLNHQKGYFKSIRGAQVYYQRRQPEVKPIGMLLVVHGVAEHSGRYGNLVDYFAPAGLGKAPLAQGVGVSD